MKKYDYMEAVMDSVDSYISCNFDLDEWRGMRNELEQELNDTLWWDSNITGYSIGSYFCDSGKAEKAICQNSDLLQKALVASGDEKLFLAGTEAWDVAIRCYVLPDAIHKLLDELEEKGFFEVNYDYEDGYY